MKTTHTPSRKNFNLMVFGQIVSVLGASLLRFALSLYVLDILGRADLFATLYAISNIPLLLTPLGGAIADRFNRRNLMVIFDFCSSFIMFCLFFLIRTGSPTIVGIGFFMVLLTTISAMYTPAVSASVPLLVEEGKIESANGIVMAVQALSAVAAPILGGILYKVIGIHTLIFISGTALFLSAVMEICIHIPFVKREQNVHILLTIARDMKVGLAYVIRQPLILKSMILAALLNLLITPLLLVGAPVILRVTMKSSDQLYGIGMALINFATVLGALTVSRFTKKLSVDMVYRWIIASASLLLPAALSVSHYILGYGYFPSFILFLAGVIPISMILTILSIFITSKVQKETTNENLGKVMAIMIAAAQCTAPVGQVLYGIVFEHYRMRIYVPILFVCAALLAVAAATKLSLKKETAKINHEQN